MGKVFCWSPLKRGLRKYGRYWLMTELAAGICALFISTVGMSVIIVLEFHSLFGLGFAGAALYLFPYAIHLPFEVTR